MSFPIDNIVGLIQGVSSQANLLAIDATTEAASAADTGKGFAVVASELKTLAIYQAIEQKSQATQEIAANVAQAASCTSNAQYNVSLIIGAADNTWSSADHVKKNTDVLIAEKNELSDTIDVFLNEVAAYGIR